MTGRSPRLEWLPPLLVGASAAVVAEVAMAMLLYGGAGFVRSLTTILATEVMAFAVGLWGAPSDGPDLVDRLRRRWIFCLFAFVVAALFGMAWSVFPQLSDGPLGQGAGLTVLAALPLYAAGGVLGGMAILAGTDPGRRLRLPGASAAVGAAAGFVLTGLLLPRVPLPASLLVGCLVMLSLGGMVYGGVLGARTELTLLARRPGRGPEARVEERRIPIDDVAVRELWEGPFLRRRILLDAEGAEPWDVALVRGLLPEARWADESGDIARDGDRDDIRILAVGGGASGLTREVLRFHSTATIEVLERTASVTELGREYFDTDLTVGRGDRSWVSVGNLDDAIAARDGSYDIVLIDTLALAPVGGLAGLSAMARRRLPALVRDGGVLACGPDGSALEAGPVPEGWSIRRYRRAAAEGLDDASIVVVQRSDGDERMLAPAGFEDASIS